MGAIDGQMAIDFDVPRAERNAGMARAAEHAERVDPDWSERAYEALRRYAQAARRFTSYDFRQAKLIESPTTDKAFGAVFQRAARSGMIRKVGFAQHPERHCSPTPIWEAA